MKKKICVIFSILFLIITGVSIIKINASVFADSNMNFNNFSNSVLNLLSDNNPKDDADKVFYLEEDLTTINNTLMVDSDTFSKITNCKVNLKNNSCEVKNNNKKVLINANDNIMLVNDADLVVSTQEAQIKNNKFYFPVEEVSRNLGFEIDFTANKLVLSNPYQTKRVIVKSNKSLDSMNAVKKVEGYNDLHIFQYQTEEDCKVAYNFYNSLKGIEWVQIDTVYSINDTYNISNEESDKTNENKNDLKHNNINKNSNSNTTNETQTLKDNKMLRTNKPIGVYGLNDNFSYTSWGADAMGVENYSNYLLSLNSLPNAIVAVLDTGLDSDHIWFKDRVVSGGKNFSASKSSTSCEYEDINGHGTHVAGTIVDLTLSNVKILPIKVMNDDGYAYSSNILLGLEYVVDLKTGETTPDGNALENGETNEFTSLIAMNLSFGGTGSGINSSNYKMYNNILTSAHNAEIISVVAAGNDGIDVKTTSPANVSCAITVSAVGQAGNTYYHPHWSNWGEFIDVSAPGEDIVSACVGGGTISLDGTSMASPHIAGIVALLYSGGNSINEIENIIKDNIIDLGVNGWDSYYGEGLVNIKYAYANSLSGVVLFSDTTIDHTECFELGLSYDAENIKIYYTNNGDEPSLNSTLYSTQVEISKTQVIRARAFMLDSDGEVMGVSKESSQLYVINNTDIDNAYTISSSGELISYNGVFNDVVVPSSYNGKNILSIGERAFIGANPNKVTLPSSVTTINRYAFYGCSNLEEVIAPNVTSIGMYAFYSCDSFTYLTNEHFPKLEIIDKYAFSNCANLQNINLSNVKTIDYFAFCMNIFTPTNLISVTLPNVKTIGDYAFYSASNITSISLPKVEILGSNSFMNCSLKTLNLPNAKYLGSQCFEGNELTSITLPEVLLIGSQCFYDCSNLISAELPKVKNIASIAFAGTSLITLNLPQVESIGVGAFSGCTQLETLIVPNLKEIKTEAFYNCLSLKEINLSNVVSIEKYAFYYIPSVTRVTLSPCLEYISNIAFYRINANCVFYIYINTPAKDFVTNLNANSSTKITYVELDSSYNDLFDYEIISNKEVYIKALKNNNLDEIIIPSYIQNLPVTKICSGAFRDNGKIKNINLPNVTTIDNNAFANCNNLKKVYLPKISYIGANAFSGCVNLEEANIQNVAFIGEYSFYNCLSLDVIKLGDNLEEINLKALGFNDNGKNNNFSLIGYEGIAQTYAENNNITFHNIFKNLERFYFNYYNNNGKQEIYISLVDSYTTGGVVIPSSYNGYKITKIGNKAFEDCVLITEIKLPSSITILGDSAFYNCTNLKSINLNYITSMGIQCFSRCENLQSVKLNLVNQIPTQAFANCYSLKIIELPETISIGDQAFFLCVGLESVISPKLENIGYAGFLDCYKLKSINLNNVKLLGTKVIPSSSGITIDGSVFQNCYELPSFIYLANIEEAGDQLFNNSSVENVVIGNKFNYYNENARYRAFHSDLIIYGYVGSLAQTYCTRHGNEFKAINEFKIVNNTQTNTSCQEGSSCIISVNARGYNIKYQWFKIVDGNAQLLEGQNQKTLSVDTSNVGITKYYAVLTNWDDQTLTSSTYTVTITPSFEITVNYNSKRGEVKAEPEGKISEGSDVTLYITCYEGCQVEKILVDSIELSPTEIENVLQNGYTFIGVNANHTFEVQFSINVYTISATCGENGALSSGNIQVEHGGSFTYNFLPNAGYHAEQVIVDGVNIGKVNSYTFTNVKSNHTLEVIFAENYYSITLVHNSFGDVQYEKQLDNIAEGENISFMVSSKEGYYIESVKCNGKIIKIDEDGFFTISNISSDIVLEVVFKEINPSKVEPNGAREAIILFGIIAGVVLVVSLPIMIIRRKRRK